MFAHDLPPIQKEPVISTTESAREGGIGAQLPASRHYQRARQDRGTETREKLILAALDAFGRYGFDGASTREIAKRADANLAAIVYHFGSKEALHYAVAEHVVASMQARSGSLFAEIDAQLDGGLVGKAQARLLLHRMLVSQIDTMVGDREADLWGRFIMREQMEPSPVFEVVYAHIMQSHATKRRLVAILLDGDPDDDFISMRAFTLFGQIVIFCIAQPMVLRTLGATEFGASDRALITQIATENIDRIVGISLEEARRS